MDDGDVDDDDEVVCSKAIARRTKQVAARGKQTAVAER
jgi:hypothetical protein